MAAGKADGWVWRPHAAAGENANPLHHPEEGWQLDNRLPAATSRAMTGFPRGLMLGIATIAVPMGLLWAGQGMGWIAWPASSFMIGARIWTAIGLVLAAAGLAAIGLLTRKPKGMREKKRRRR